MESPNAAGNKRSRKSEALQEESVEPGSGGSSRVKRQRVSRACDQCRLSREKCNGLKPTCQTCVLNNRECTYATHPKKRGIQPGYIRTLELSLAWLFSQDIGAEELLKRALATEGGEIQRLLSGKASSDSEALHGRWSSGIVCRQIDQLLSGAEVDSPSDAPQDAEAAQSQLPWANDAKSSLDGQSPAIEATHAGSLLHEVHELHVPRVAGMPPPRANSSNRRTITGQQSLTQSTSETYDSRATKAADNSVETDRLRLPADFWKLLDVYYAFTHPWLPISNKNDVLKTAYSYGTEGKTISQETISSGLHAELWAIIALGYYQANDSSEFEDVDVMVSRVHRLIPGENGPFTLGHAKALTLLTLLYLGRRAWTAAWMTIGSAVRILINLDLHVLAATTNDPIQQPVRCKHLVMACFVMEAVLQRCLGKPGHLTAKLIASIGYLDEDGLEEWDPWDNTGGTGALATSSGFRPSRQPARSPSIFNALVRILCNSPQSEMSLMGLIPANRAADAATRKVSTFASLAHLLEEPSTPQQMHLMMISLWIDVEAGLASEDVLLNTILHFLRRYASYGLAMLPPTLVPLIESLAQRADPRSPAGQAIVSLATALLNVWTRSKDVRATVSQAMAPQGLPPPVRASSNDLVKQGLPSSSRSSETLTQRKYTADKSHVQHAHGRPPPSIDTGHRQHSLINNSNNINLPARADYTPTLSISSNFHQGVQAVNIPQDRATIATFLDQSTPEYYSDGGTNAADLEAIFEEIAMLDGNRQATDGSQFMQNLGVGPDLDLSAFFGADYQQSDPMFAYLQPDSFAPADAPRRNGAYPGS